MMNWEIVKILTSERYLPRYTSDFQLPVNFKPDKPKPSY